jgi:hypothetical protein
MAYPYLPDVMQGVVDRVSAKMNTGENGFKVFFAYGTYEEVSRWVAKNPDKFPFVYLFMPFKESQGKAGIFSEIDARLVIVMKTNPEWTQPERDENTIKSVLIPVYDELMVQLAMDPMFSTASVNGIRRDRTIKPYNGQGDVNGTDADNLFKNYVDWIDVQNLLLKLRFC